MSAPLSEQLYQGEMDPLALGESVGEPSFQYALEAANIRISPLTS
jgi:hypothetical protein